MATTIAISGKGGSGKTTLTAMIIRALLGRGSGGILAVDADPNSCLGLTMGVELTGTVARLRENARRKQPDAGGMDRVRTFEYGLQQAITEEKGFDLLTMGRPEGPDCYCAVNNLLRKFLDKLSDSYSFVIIDNEAGMEHLSRRTTNNVDVLCIAAESSPIGAVTAQRIFELAKELPVAVKRIGVIWNRTENEKELYAIESLGCVPYDQALFEASMQGKNIFDLGQHTPAFSAVRNILEKLNIGTTK
jgi:CO dehydrogenase maturation factor